tara:strand:- start:32717 stop:33007 length:291 start_codon:yes stop_codon:yes gene_type:complete
MNDKILLLNIPDEQVTETLTDAINNGKVERGLIIRSYLGREIFKEFSNLKDKGYFPVGMILSKDLNVEFMFQRHPKQTKEMKMVELKTPKSLKYNL